MNKTLRGCRGSSKFISLINVPFSCDHLFGYAKRHASKTEVLLLPAFVLADFKKRHPSLAPRQTELKILPSRSGPILGVFCKLSISSKMLLAGSPFFFVPLTKSFLISLNFPSTSARMSSRLESSQCF